MTVRRQSTVEPKVPTPDLTFVPEHFATKAYIAEVLLAALLPTLTAIHGGSPSATGPLALFGGTPSSTPSQFVHGGSP